MKPVLAFAFAFALVATALAGGAHAVDVYKWKDSKGVVHTGRTDRMVASERTAMRCAS